MMMMTKEYKDKLKVHAARKITYILDSLGVKYSRHGELIQACCPAAAHGGDGNNTTAFSWRFDYEHWVCWTHHCQEDYGGDIFGLVRAVLECSFPEAQKWVANILKKQNVDLNEEVESRVTTNNGAVHLHRPLDEQRILFLKPDHPPKMLLDRGFSPEVLKDYQVGGWNRLGTFMDNRIVFPVRDHDSRLVGFTGRTFLSEEEREEFNANHPDKEISKWVHGRYFDRFSGELKTGSVLFNLNRAQEHLGTRRILITEGPLDGLVFEMAEIFNWGATLGTSFQPQHRSLLIERGVNEIVTAFDNDKAGRKAHERVVNVVGDLMRVYPLEGMVGDPGDYAKNPAALRELYYATT